ncbi:NAD(P)H nitroreductase [Flocculibacter collagenilyticus]|uniref:NAD(P)H nitroreductase n=1 Tax=Flocculibacter collagenilyticus TaxID=2744479 RepID=UPI0018F74155|nr:NAD(P)H nitroreductase [Flocculibacter collagenilyticus]
MSAHELLTNRKSCARLTTPAPSKAQMNIIQTAALRVPDHAALKPWQFVIFEGDEALSALGKIYADAALKTDPEVEPAQIERAKQLPHRAPMVILCIAKYAEHPKVPHFEQIISAGCTVMAMQQAAFSMGLGAMWRTGSYAENRHVHDAFNLTEQDQIVGFLYLGTPVHSVPDRTVPDFEDYFSYWKNC